MDSAISPVQGTSAKEIEQISEQQNRRQIPDTNIAAADDPESLTAEQQEELLAEAITEGVGQVAVGFLGVMISEGNNLASQHQRRTEEAMQDTK